MAELCHVCDLFRTALFGPTNSSEDHLDDGQGNDLPRPMADAPAIIGGRSRNRPSSMRNAKSERNPDAVAQPTGGNGTTATPSVTSEAAAPTSAALAAAQMTAPAGPAETVTAVSEAPAGKPVPRTKFSKRNSRGTKSPAYMSFDDVDIEEDDSDGELFVDEHRASGSRSPGGFAAAYTVSKSSVPSVYREPDLSASVAKAPVAPPDAAPSAPAYNVEAGSSGQVGVGAGTSTETFPTATSGSMALRLNGTGLGDDRVSIPRDGSTLESARPHGQSESFHGYKGYPGYEPDTPVAEHLSRGRTETGESQSIHPGTEIVDPRSKVKTIAAPSPSRSRHNTHPEATVLVVGKNGGGPADPNYSYGEVQPHYHPHSDGPPSAAVEADHFRGPHYDHVRVTSNRQQQHHQPPAQYHQQQQNQHQSMNAGPGVSYSSQMSGGYRERDSPVPSGAGSMTSSFRRDESSRNMSHMPSEEDEMGSVLGAIAATEDSQNEDLQWKRSALKKFHKVMVKGEGLRVVKHNRSGGSQVRIIRYDPEIKALVWNSKRYMKKAGSANVPIVGIKRVGREGNTVSVTAAGRGTIGFEPQRIRDAKILAEALRALVDKEERSAMWRG